MILFLSFSCQGFRQPPEKVLFGVLLIYIPTESSTRLCLVFACRLNFGVVAQFWTELSQRTSKNHALNDHPCAIWWALGTDLSGFWGFILAVLPRAMAKWPWKIQCGRLQQLLENHYVLFDLPQKSWIILNPKVAAMKRALLLGFLDWVRSVWPKWFLPILSADIWLGI